MSFALAPDRWTPDAVRALRERLGMTQEDFAREAGVTHSTVIRWENDHAAPSKLAMFRLDALSALERSRA